MRTRGMSMSQVIPTSTGIRDRLNRGQRRMISMSIQSTVHHVIQGIANRASAKGVLA